jgi:hypothetical protein
MRELLCCSCYYARLPHFWSVQAESLFATPTATQLMIVIILGIMLLKIIMEAFIPLGNNQIARTWSYRSSFSRPLKLMLQNKLQIKNMSQSNNRLAKLHLFYLFKRLIHFFCIKITIEISLNYQHIIWSLQILPISLLLHQEKVDYCLQINQSQAANCVI